MSLVKVQIVTCPLQRDLTAFLDHSQKMHTAMRSLRRDLATCRDCPHKTTCDSRKRFNQQIAQTIQEINDEYHLAEFYH